MDESCEIDVELTNPGDEVIERAVELANNVIWEDRQITINTATREEAWLNAAVISITSANNLDRNYSTSTPCRLRIRPVKAKLKKFFGLRSITAVALIFWCAGTGCMLVSYAHSAMVPNVALQFSEQVMNSASGSMDAHACCKARHKSAKRIKHTPELQSSNNGLSEVTLPLSPVPTDAMSCCPLTSGSIVASSRAQSNDDNKSVSTQTDSFILKLSSTQPSPLAIPLRLPNRDQTYLRCCVFLI